MDKGQARKGKVSDIDADTWVKYSEDMFLFKGSNPPWENSEHELRLSEAWLELEAWGVADATSNLLKLFPEAIATGNTDLLKPKNMEKRYPIAV